MSLVLFLLPLLLVIGVFGGAFYLSGRISQSNFNRIGLALAAAGVVAAVLVFYFPAAVGITPPGAAGSAGSSYADRIRNQILTARDDAEVDRLVASVWSEGDTDLDEPSNMYGSSGCAHRGYGLAWNVQHEGKSYINTVIAFTTQQRLERIPDRGSFYVRVCLLPGLDFSAEDAAKIQAAVMQYRSKNEDIWSYQVID